MPVYDWRESGNTTRRAKLFDAATGELHLPVFFWDSDTGRVGRYLKDAAGAKFVDPATGRAALTWEVRPGLRIVWEGEPGYDDADTPHVVGPA